MWKHFGLKVLYEGSKPDLFSATKFSTLVKPAGLLTTRPTLLVLMTVSRKLPIFIVPELFRIRCMQSLIPPPYATFSLTPVTDVIPTPANRTIQSIRVIKNSDFRLATKSTNKTKLVYGCISSWFSPFLLYFEFHIIEDWFWSNWIHMIQS